MPSWELSPHPRERQATGLRLASVVRYLLKDKVPRAHTSCHLRSEFFCVSKMNLDFAYELVRDLPHPAPGRNVKVLMEGSLL